jgi:hypothetical protein
MLMLVTSPQVARCLAVAVRLAGGVGSDENQGSECPKSMSYRYLG